MKKVSEVSKVAGVTKRTLQYYDNLGLMSTSRSKENYRLYDEQALEELWRILLLKEIGFELDDIKEIIIMSEERKEEVMNLQVEKVKQNIKDLKIQLRLVETIQKHGLPPVCFEDNNILNYTEFIYLFKQIFGIENIKEGEQGGKQGGFRI